MRRLWWCSFGTVIAAGALGAAVALGPVRGLGTLAVLGAVGAVVGYAMGRESRNGRYGALVGASLAAAPVLVDGLVRLLGPVAGVTVSVVVVGTAPFVTTPTARWLRSRPSARADVAQAALAGPDEALRRQWLASTAELERARNDRERLEVVHVREQILDALADEGRLPDFVFDQPGKEARGRD